MFRDAGKNDAVGSHEYREDNDPAIKTSKILSWAVVPSFANVHSWLFMHDRVNQREVGSTVYNFQNGGCVSPTQTKIFLNLNRKESMQNIDILIFSCDIFTYRNDFANALGVQHRNLSIAIVLIYVRVAYVNLIATGIVFKSGHLAAILAEWWHSQSIGDE